MEFRTLVVPESSSFRIGYDTRGLMLGSCFICHIGNKMQRLKLPVCVNPFGVIYNPASVVRSLIRMENPCFLEEKDLFLQQGIWSSFDYHSTFSSPRQEEALSRMNTALEHAASALRKSDYLILTLGTAWVYKHKRTNRIVCNCHKVRADEFERYLLSPEEIERMFSGLLEQELYRDKQILFTVSPIRHLKDGLAGNTRSKAHLITAVHRLAERFGNVDYFPAYEIMMDDLRDYRFYVADMIHPSPVAVDYIWERFAETWIAPESRNLFGRIEKITAAKEHRPFNKSSDGYRQFVRSMLDNADKLQQDFPFLDFREEIDFFSNCLTE